MIRRVDVDVRRSRRNHFSHLPIIDFLDCFFAFPFIAFTPQTDLLSLKELIFEEFMDVRSYEGLIKIKLNNFEDG